MSPPVPNPVVSPASSFPDFIQRAVFTIGPFLAAGLLSNVPVVADWVPGGDDLELLTAGIGGVLLWLASYVYRWVTGKLSRPALPVVLADRVGEAPAVGGPADPDIEQPTPTGRDLSEPIIEEEADVDRLLDQVDAARGVTA